MKWKIILVCFLFLCAVQVVNADNGDNPSLYGDGFSRLPPLHELMGCEGVYATTSRNSCPGFHATTYGRYSDGFQALTHDRRSQGFQAITKGDNSEGLRAITEGDDSDGVYTETYGLGSGGFEAETWGSYSYGVRTNTHGYGSDGVHASTDGNGSRGVCAYSAYYHGVEGTTHSSEAYGGLFLNRDPRLGYALAAGHSAENINFKVSNTGNVWANGNLEVEDIDTHGDIHASGDIYSFGTKPFVMEHPHNESKEIVYTALEGDEAGVYTRGTAQLGDGAAAVQLPEHFELVASDEGLTVQVTPLGNCNGLYVEHKSNQKIVVKELMDGKSDVHFDYYVQGVRTGYEEYEVIRDKN